MYESVHLEIVGLVDQIDRIQIWLGNSINNYDFWLNCNLLIC